MAIQDRPRVVGEQSCARAAQLPAGARGVEYRALSREIVRLVNSGVSRIDFLRELAGVLLDFSACDSVELRVRGQDQCFRCEATRRSMRPIALEVIRCPGRNDNALLAGAREADGLDGVRRMVVERTFPGSTPCFTDSGSFWTGDLKRTAAFLGCLEGGATNRAPRGAGRCSSLAILPLAAADETIGLLQLRSNGADFFRAADIECYEGVAHTVALALVSQLAHASLRERIKELTCLYNLAQLAERPGIQLGEVFHGVVGSLPAAWQYPEIAAARLFFDGRSYATANFSNCVARQCADLIVKERQRGTIEVGYIEHRPDLDEGPFLKEERSLIDTVARQIVVLVERREAAEDSSRLEDQLRHADRLATIGQLSAGVAHELNEPLGNILAFAQLAARQRGVPGQVARDLDKIVASSLHAREIIKKLMLFARQMPPRKTPVSLNAVVEEGLYFLEARCAKEGVLVARHLATGLPELVADPPQLNQILVNLVVNAIQAMPAGGTLTIATRAAGSQVVLTVEDTGTGMNEEVLGKIFTPFFTTKDIHEGTGLGLPVVHGIVSAHGGAIGVTSAPGRGTRFEIFLPVNPGDRKERHDHEIAP